MANENQSTILITGGAGYIGSWVTRRLLASGNRVVVFDNMMYGGKSLLGVLGHPNLRIIKGDVRQVAEVDSAMDGIDHVVHLAAIVGEAACDKDPDVTRAIDFGGTQNVAQSARSHDVKRMVFFSTCSSYGVQDTGVLADEETQLNPVSLYAECKVAVERHVLDHAGEVDFCPTVLRIATAYGFSQRMRFDLTVSEFTRKLALGKPLLVYDENTWRPYCHVVDLARAVITVLDAKPEQVSGEVFNVGNSDENFTKRMIIDVIEQALGESGAEYKKGGVDPRNYRVSFNKISAALGFHNSRSVGEEVAMLVAAVRQGLFTDDGSDPNLYGNREITGAS